MLKLLETCWKKEWTKLYGWTKVAVGSSLLSFHYIGTLISNPEVKDALSKIDMPAYVTLGLAILGVITIASVAHED